MTERATELSSLKQEVAELWSRYRKDEPVPGDEVERQRLGAQLRALEVKHRELIDRRSALRSGIEAERRRVSAFVPVLQMGGAVVGVVVSLLTLGVVLPTVADWSLSLGTLHGALAVGLSTLSLPFLLASR
ncbi:MAG: hypothetical protein Q8S33_11430 [Myxococcales bacterium]|nr:hypothetical protein [Myxococcales bacterium]